MAQDVLGEVASKARGVSQVRAHAGDVLFRPLDPCRGFIAVRRGAIKVMLAAARGRIDLKARSILTHLAQFQP